MVPWDLFLEVSFQSTSPVFLIHVNWSSVEKWGGSSETIFGWSLSFKISLRGVCEQDKTGSFFFFFFYHRRRNYMRSVSQSTAENAPDIKAWHLWQEVVQSNDLYCDHRKGWTEWKCKSLTLFTLCMMGNIVCEAEVKNTLQNTNGSGCVCASAELMSLALKTSLIHAPMSFRTQAEL